MRRVRDVLVACVLLAVVSPARSLLAQQGPAEPDAPPRYAVELIIFRHLDASRTTAEAPPLALLGERPGGVQSGAEQTRSATDAAIRRRRQRNIDFLLLEPEPQPPDFLPVDPAALKLDRVYRRIDRLDAYAAIMQLAWSQGAGSRVGQQFYFITAADERRSGVGGSIRLYQERYLHLELDLEYGGAGTGAGNWQNIKGSRRIRLGQHQYFDNPVFGVIAVVHTLEPAALPPETLSGPR